MSTWLQTSHNVSNGKNVYMAPNFRLILCYSFLQLQFTYVSLYFKYMFKWNTYECLLICGTIKCSVKSYTYAEQLFALLMRSMQPITIIICCLTTATNQFFPPVISYISNRSLFLPNNVRKCAMFAHCLVAAKRSKQSARCYVK